MSVAQGNGRAPRTLWVCSELYHPERTSTGRFLTGIAEGLAPHMRVEVVCSQPTYSARGTLAPREELHNGVRIHRCRSTRLDKNVLPFRGINAGTLAVSAYWTLARRLRRGDTVLVVTNPPLLPLVLAPLVRSRGARLLVLVHDVYPEVLVATGMRAPDSRLVRLLRRAYDRVYRGAESVIVLGRDMQRLIRERIPERADRVVILPNWAEREIAPVPREANPVLEHHRLQGHFVVQYLGNMGRTHDLEVLVEAARRLREEGIGFLFVGAGARRRWLMEAVERDGLDNVRLAPECSDRELPDHLGACDIAVIPFLPGMAGVSVPSRMYNVMAAGRPILAAADADSELAAVVGEEACGWVVAPSDADAVVATIRRLVHDPATVRAAGENARRAAEQKYAEAHVIDGYRRLLAELEH